jgi:hypothetical protein
MADLGISEDSMSDEKPTIERAPIRAITPTSAAVRTGIGSTWVPRSRRGWKNYAGTQLTTGNQREPIPNPVEESAPRAPRVTEHRVVTHTFADSTIYTQCLCDGCPYGSGDGRTIKGSKRHSDGRTKRQMEADDLAEHIEEVLSEDETSEDEIQELGIAPVTPMLEDVEYEADEESESSEDELANAGQEGKGEPCQD